MRPRGCSAGLAALLLAGCVAPTPYPAGWPPASGCAPPEGTFAAVPAEGTWDDGTGAPRLTRVFFGPLLDGFAVTHVSISGREDGAIEVTPWVDAVALPERAIVQPAGRRCAGQRWRATSGWDWDGYMAATGLVYTGGIIVPAASRREFLVRRTEAGDLAVRARDHTTGTMFFFFPFRFLDDDAWFLYSRLEPAD